MVNLLVGWCRHIAACAGMALSLLAVGPAAAQMGAGARPPEAIYARVCGYCHGQHVAVPIRGRQLPVEMIMQFVRTGPGPMPAFRQTEISDVELKALARWVHESKADPKEHAK